jgi:hypothetical protein
MTEQVVKDAHLAITLHVIRQDYEHALKAVSPHRLHLSPCLK